jgi:hypothetical protein
VFNFLYLLPSAFAAWFQFSLAGSALSPREFSYEDLVHSIESAHVNTVEQALTLFPESMRSNYTLIFNSRSLQSASEENPRAVLFGRSGKFVCAFNGDFNQRGFDTLECIQFRDRERIFDFRTIQFPSAENPSPKVIFSENLGVGSRSNCSACHAVDARPNWSETHVWAGVYGAQDDRMDSETENSYRNFSAHRSLNPRYRSLIQSAEPGAPFRASVLASGLDSDRSGFSHRPNLRFSNLTTKWNAKRLARLLTQLPERKSLAYALGALQCTKTPDATTRKILIPYLEEIDLSTIRARLGVSDHEWTTQVFGDEPGAGNDQPSVGHENLSVAVAMVIVSDLAAAGDASLQSNLVKLGEQNDAVLKQDDHSKALNEITPEFGNWTGAKAKLLCPELAILMSHFIRE